jgi:hypothetical protein
MAKHGELYRIAQCLNGEAWGALPYSAVLSEAWELHSQSYYHICADGFQVLRLSNFLTEIVYAINVSFVRATCPARLIFPYLIIPICDEAEFPFITSPRPNYDTHTRALAPFDGDDQRDC